jgi:IMP dehydrogenase
MQEIYSAEIKPDLIAERVKQIRDGGVTVAGALTPQRTQQFWKTVVDAGVDLFVIRGTTVSAEHVSARAEPLNLKRFIYELDVPVIVGGCATYAAALHLMRPVRLASWSGRGELPTTRATLRSTPDGDRYRRRRDADATTDSLAAGMHASPTVDGSLRRMVEPSPQGGRRHARCRARAWRHPGVATMSRRHTSRCRVAAVRVGTVGALGILLGPGLIADGTTTSPALRRAAATTGYSDLKEFQRVEVVVSPYRPSIGL